MGKAILLGGTGTLRCTAESLADAGWDVLVTGRDPRPVPAGWSDRGISFRALDSRDVAAVDRLVQGADLLVDATCMEPHETQDLARRSREVGCTVQLSSKAVYRDQVGDMPEEGATTPWDGEVVDSRRGYSACKAECERVLARDGERVSVLRLAKVHGPGCRRPREWAVVKRVLDGRGAILLPGDGGTRESTTAASLLAETVLACAAAPEHRVLNVADGAPVTVRAMVAAVVVAAQRAAGRDRPDVTLVPGPVAGDWRLPWTADHRVATERLEELLGHALPSYFQTVGQEVEWLVSVAEQGPDGLFELPEWCDREFFEGAFPYSAEDAVLLA